MQKPLTIGIMGAANIAREFATAVAGSKKVSITAIASRSLEKAQSFAKQYNIPHSYGSYEALLADTSIDIIYIPLPNALHAEWAIKSAAAGKHILCEKPLAMSVAEVKSMFAAAHQHHVILREAYPYLAQPHMHQVLAWIKEGAIGKINHMRSAMSVLFTNPNDIRLTKDVGGGALYDAGVYAISLTLAAIGARPVRVQAVAQIDARGVDRTTMATLQFADGTLAQICASFSSAYTRHAMIMGDQGAIQTNFQNHPPFGEEPLLRIRRGIASTIPYESHPVPTGNGFLLEAEEFADLVRTGKGWSGTNEQDSIDIAMTVDAIYKSLKSEQWEAV